MGSPALGLPYVAWMEYGVPCDRKPSPSPSSDQLKQKRNCGNARNHQVQGVLGPRWGQGQRALPLFGLAPSRGSSGQLSPPGSRMALLGI